MEKVDQASSNNNKDVGDAQRTDDIDFLEDRWFLFNDARVSAATYSSFSNVTKRFQKVSCVFIINHDFFFLSFSLTSNLMIIL